MISLAQRVHAFQVKLYEMPAVYNLACLQVGKLFAYLFEEQAGGHWPEGGFELRVHALEGVD